MCLMPVVSAEAKYTGFLLKISHADAGIMKRGNKKISDSRVFGLHTLYKYNCRRIYLSLSSLDPGRTKIAA